jgi:riboflavin kinase/FMN adenylyltransferase
MQVHTEPGALPTFRNAVVTIGTFDGVHRGHRRIIAQMREVAADIRGETVIITFHPHPRMVVRGGRESPGLLTTPDERIRLLSGLGVDHLVVIPFTTAFSEMEAEEYVSDFLVRRFKPHTLIIGFDHRFGKGREGDYELLERLSGPFGYRVMEIDAQVLDEAKVSSSRIRNALLEGRASEAAELLGYPYTFSGRVVPGDRRGRELGFPTANLEAGPTWKLVPADGVYAVRAGLEGEESAPAFAGMMNIGFRPTVDGAKRVTEVHLFDFDRDIYGKTLRVGVVERIRDEMRFSGLDALRQQLQEDRKNALHQLSTGPGVIPPSS